MRWIHRISLHRIPYHVSRTLFRVSYQHYTATRDPAKTVTLYTIKCS